MRTLLFFSMSLLLSPLLWAQSGGGQIPSGRGLPERDRQPHAPFLRLELVRRRTS